MHTAKSGSIFTWRRHGDAWEPAEQSAKTGVKFVVHAAVDERIVTALAHG